MNTREELAEEKLKKALSQLIATRNIYEITVKEICEEANINRSTFYRYYKDPNELLGSLIKEASDKLKMKLLEDPIVNEKSLCRYLEYIKSNIDYFEPLFFSDSCISFRELFCEETFRVTVFLGDFKGKDIECLSTFISHGSLAVIEEWIEGGFEEKAEKIAHKIYIYNEAVISLEIG